MKSAFECSSWTPVTAGGAAGPESGFSCEQDCLHLMVGSKCLFFFTVVVCPWTQKQAPVGRLLSLLLSSFPSLDYFSGFVHLRWE